MWRPYKQGANRFAPIPGPYLSIAQTFYAKEISLPLMFSMDSPLVGREGGAVSGRPEGPGSAWAEGLLPGVLPASLLQSAAANLALPRSVVLQPLSSALDPVDFR